jgi:hypothetical protein
MNGWRGFFPALGGTRSATYRAYNDQTRDRDRSGWTFGRTMHACMDNNENSNFFSPPPLKVEYRERREIFSPLLARGRGATRERVLNASARPRLDKRARNRLNLIGSLGSLLTGRDTRTARVHRRRPLKRPFTSNYMDERGHDEKIAEKRVYWATKARTRKKNRRPGPPVFFFRQRPERCYLVVAALTYWT